MIEISPKAFLFDFDGVICDSEKAHMLAALKAIEPQNIGFTEEYYFEKLFGFDDVGLFNHLYSVNHKTPTPELLKAFIEQKDQAFFNLIEKETTIYSGAKDLVKRLKSKNIPVAIVSGAFTHEIKGCLEKSNIKNEFEFIVGADSVKHSKPDPESYELGYTKMLQLIPDLEKSDIWVLEDSPTGIFSATGAELNVIGITNTTKAENLSSATHVVSDYSEIQII